MTVPGPIIPPWFDALTWIGFASVAALTVASIVLIARTPRFGSLDRTVWIAVVVLVPIVGAIVWFIFQWFQKGGPRGEE
ncbi:MAG: PLDc N-terminal domain-containing protein [Microcella sp.]